MTDIEIAQAHEMKKIVDVAAKAGIDEFMDGVGVVTFHDDFRRKSSFSAVGFQNVPEHESLGRGDVVSVCEISQIDVGQPGMAVGKGKHHDQVFPEKGDGVFILHMMNAGIEGEIRMFRSGFHLGVDDFQHGFGMVFPEFRQK